jgi:hypothetical protein
MSIQKLGQSVINIKTAVLWDVMLCSLVGGYQCSVFRSVGANILEVSTASFFMVEQI